MNSIQFCYWLQGLFELADARILSIKQTSLVKEKLAVVLATDKQALSFCSWLKGVLDTLELLEYDNLNAVQFKLIQKGLHETFAKHIDPSYGQEFQDILNHIHQPGFVIQPQAGLNPGHIDELIRC